MRLNGLLTGKILPKAYCFASCKPVRIEVMIPFVNVLPLYQTTIFWTLPNSKHLQTANRMLLK